MAMVALAAFLIADHEEAIEIKFLTTLRNRQLPDASDPFMIGRNFPRLYRYVKMKLLILYHCIGLLKLSNYVALKSLHRYV